MRLNLQDWKLGKKDFDLTCKTQQVWSGNHWWRINAEHWGIELLQPHFAGHIAILQNLKQLLLTTTSPVPNFQSHNGSTPSFQNLFPRASVVLLTALPTDEIIKRKESCLHLSLCLAETSCSFLVSENLYEALPFKTQRPFGPRKTLQDINLFPCNRWHQNNANKFPKNFTDFRQQKVSHAGTSWEFKHLSGGFCSTLN